jgi:hypothetical protein
VPTRLLAERPTAPLTELPVGEQVLAPAMAHAPAAILESRWYLTAPAQYKLRDPPVTLSGVEFHPVYTSIGGLPSGSIEPPFLYGWTEVGGIRAAFRLRLDFGRGGFVISEKGGAS